MEAGMTRGSGSPRAHPVRGMIRGMAASCLVAFWLCAAAIGQDAGSEPPPLTPLPPSHRLAPLAPPPMLTPPASRNTARAARDEAIQRVGSLVPSSPVGIPAIEALPSSRGQAAFDAIVLSSPLFGDYGPPSKEAQTVGSLEAQIRLWPERAEPYYQRGRFHVRRAESGVWQALDAAKADFSRALER